MRNRLLPTRIIFGFFALFTIACSSGGSSNPNPGTAGTTGSAGSGSAGTTGTAGDTGTGTAGTGGNPVVVTPEGTLLMDDFESGAARWMVTQGTCSIMADGPIDGGGMSNGTNIFNCINGGNEARAVGGMIGWGEYSVQAKVKVNAMDMGRRIYLAARYTDSSNWYGAAIYNGNPYEVQIRKKVANASSDIARTTFPLELGKWYTLKLEVKGSTLRLSVDGVIQLEATDTQFASGQVALLVDRSDISWDDVLVTNP